MPRRKRRHIHWPLLGILLLMVSIVVGSIFLSAWATVAFNHRRFGMEWQQALLSRTFDVLLGVWFVVVGASIGSFLNVVAYRLPRGMSINGFSRCPFCRTNIRGEDNIPLLGWIRLRGRCRACRLPIAARYPGFELLGAGLALILFLFEFLTHGANLPLVKVPSEPYGMLAGRMDWMSLTRALWHLTLLYFLMGAAMISWGGEIAPKRLFVVGALAWIAAAIFCPEVYPIAWSSLSGFVATPIDGSNPVAKGIDGIITYSVGGLIGWITALVMLGSAYQMIAIPSENRRKDVAAWLSAWSLIGVALGWQGVLSSGLLSIATLAIILAIRSIRGQDAITNPLAWLWAAVTLHLITWSQTNRLGWWPGENKPWWIGLGSLLAIAFGSWVVSRMSTSQEPTAPQIALPTQSDSDEMEALSNPK